MSADNTPTAIAPGRSGAKVTVICKLPHGLVLRVFDTVNANEPLPGGGTKSVKRSQPRPENVTIRGYLERYDPALPPLAVGSRFALTHNVDKDFFELWLKQNHDLDAVRNGLVAAYASPDGAQAMANERERDVRSGLEPIDPRKLVGKRVETAEEQQKRLGL